MNPKKIRRCVLYARISVATEESVSIESQIEAGTAHARARGWEIVGVFRDEGVSATYKRPEDRKGWRDLIDSPAPYDAVVVLKVDRVARRVVDFLHVNEALKARKASLVAVRENIDLTTAQGEAFATIVAVFGQMEAATIRERVTAARDKLLRDGRYAGGALLYGYKAVPNPDGPGWVVVQDEDEIGYVREAVARTQAGRSIYSTMKWLNETGAPTKTGAGKWSYNTLDRLLRHPLLAGMVPHNPGNTTGRTRGSDVVRDENGLPVIDETLAIMPVGEWRAMQAKLAEPNPHRKPRAMRRQHSGLLSGLMWCGDPRHDEPVRMWRGTVGSATGPRPAYTCPQCHQTLSNAEALIVSHIMEQRGDLANLDVIEEVLEGGAVEAQEATVRLAELGRALVTASVDELPDLMAEIEKAKAVQEAAAARPAQVRYKGLSEASKDDLEAVQTVAEAYAAAPDDETRRDVLGRVVDQIIVRRTGAGRWTDADKLARMEFVWLPAGQVDRPTDEELADWAE